ncbi:MAG: hypothetical protein U5L76_05760 [Patescibacteria group bacterium]|nr:hypothetical protein [Patescibacteria group bacterium]MDZ7799072.1 hypothetical protein [Patescibacteria group bacterium]
MVKEPIKNIDYTKKETLKKYQDYLEYLYTFDKYKDAYAMARALPNILSKIDNFKEKYQSFYKSYQEVIKYAKILSINFLKEEEIIELFRNNLFEILDIDFPEIYEKVKTKISTLMFFEDRDALKKKLIAAIQENNQKVGEEEIVVNEKSTEPTIKDWLRDCQINMDLKKNDALSLAAFINNSKNIQNLKKERDKIIISKLYEIYNNLHISSSSMEGLERKITVIDKNGVKRVFNNGRMEKINVDEKTKKEFDIAEKILIKYGYKRKEESNEPEAKTSLKKETEKTDREKDKALKKETKNIQDKVKRSLGKYQELMRGINNEEANIIKSSGQNSEKIKLELFDNIKENNGENLSAYLFILSRLRELKNINKEEKFKDIFKQEIILLLKKQMPELDEQKQISKFEENFNHPIYTKIFIKYLLSKAFSSDKSAGSFVATQLENIFMALNQKELLGLAYFDLKTENYKWAETSLENGQLVLR